MKSSRIRFSFGTKILILVLASSIGLSLITTALALKEQFVLQKIAETEKRDASG